MKPTTNVSYELYKDEKIECPYCESVTNLYDISRHMKGKRCQRYKELYLQVNKHKTEAEIELYINGLKKKVYNSELLEE
jgi:hypothetical protein